MTRIDPLADAMVNLKNHEAVAKGQCMIRPASKLLGEILRIMRDKQYIENFEMLDDGKSGIYRVNLAGKINECKAIKPRYAVGKNEFEKFEKRYLPSRDIGILIVSTSDGVTTHREAKAKKVGGRLIAYVY